MWNGTVAFQQLQERSRWKVEFFCADGPSRLETAFDSAALREVVVERRESLDPQLYPNHMFNYLGLEHVQSLTGDLAEDFQPGAEKRCFPDRRYFGTVTSSTAGCDPLAQQGVLGGWPDRRRDLLGRILRSHAQRRWHPSPTFCEGGFFLEIRAGIRGGSRDRFGIALSPSSWKTSSLLRFLCPRSKGSTRLRPS